MDTAFKTFDFLNDIKEVDPQDQIYYFDEEENKRINNDKNPPWKNDPHYFKTCKISAIALIKMVIHARSGGVHEIMGLMQGKVQGTSIIIMDSFALPVQGTETRVNAQDEANTYMVEYRETGEKAGRREHAIGWYHSHPGYGCWLSGIDVDTQKSNQTYQDPWVAVVIDPNRTVSAGKVDIGAFRTYPEGYKPPNSTAEYQSIPLSKIEDFGVHADAYYQLDIQIFKSKLDDKLLGLLWNKYWVNTLSQSPIISNRAYAASQLTDLATKLAKAQSSVTSRSSSVVSAALAGTAAGPGGKSAGGTGGKGKEKDKAEFAATPKKEEGKKDDSALAKVVKDSTRITSEAQHGLISQVLKDYLFSTRPGTETDLASRLDPVAAA